MKIKSVMVVDDSEADQYISKRVIKKYDDQIEIFTAWDGEEALKMLQEMPDQPSLILLDLNMPRMGGFEFLQNYRELNMAAVVVMLSSSDQDRDKETAFAFESVKKYLVKPLTTEDFASLFTD